MVVVFPSHTHCFLCIDFSLSKRFVVSSLFDLAPIYTALTLFCDLVHSDFFLCFNHLAWVERWFAL